MLPSQREKVDFLLDPGNYRDTVRAVSAIETHHAWVFLTENFAYKMKKPFRHGSLDFSSLESRHYLCNEEFTLNQRLAPRTYLGVVPLTVSEDGRLALEGGGTVVEWLVKMRRLPEHRMLHVAATEGRVTRRDVRSVMQKLMRFYDEAPRCTAFGRDYPLWLAENTQQVRDALSSPRFGYDAGDIDPIIGPQLAYIDANNELLQRRARSGLIREIHGDLRPEHICLPADGELEIIDRLEFDPDLRCLDPVEELAFFGLECRLIGAAWIETECIATYTTKSGDRVPEHLWNFFAARRATIRAWLAARHVLDADDRKPWLHSSRDYLALGLLYLNRSDWCDRDDSSGGE